jgi:hypothetical protein
MTMTNLRQESLNNLEGGVCLNAQDRQQYAAKIPSCSFFIFIISVFCFNWLRGRGLGKSGGGRNNCYIVPLIIISTPPNCPRP